MKVECVYECGITLSKRALFSVHSKVRECRYGKRITASFPFGVDIELIRKLLVIVIKIELLTVIHVRRHGALGSR